METNIQDIINKIKTEGVQEAELQATQIIKASEEKSQELISTAETTAEKIINNAKEEAEKILNNGKMSLAQASRDVELKLKEKLSKLFNKALQISVSNAMEPNALKEMLIKFIESSAKDENVKWDILLSEHDKNQLQNLVINETNKLFSEGISLKVSDKLFHGFRIGKSDTGFYMDFSDEAVTEAILEYLNPKIKELISINE